MKGDWLRPGYIMGADNNTGTPAAKWYGLSPSEWLARGKQEVKNFGAFLSDTKTRLSKTADAWIREIKDVEGNAGKPAAVIMVKDSTGKLIPAHSTLISPDDSVSRAAELMRGKTGQTVVHYYMVEGDAGMPEAVTSRVERSRRKQSPNFAAGAQAKPINQLMRELIDSAVSDINSKMAGTIKMVPVASPDAADIIVAGAKNVLFDGATFNNGIVFLNESSFSDDIESRILRQIFSRRKQFQQKTVRHEFLHALGVEHPHEYQKSALAPSSTEVPCAETVMAYNSLCAGNSGIPSNTLGRVDIAALKQLYGGNRVAADTSGHGLSAGAAAVATAAVRAEGSR